MKTRSTIVLSGAVALLLFARAASAHPGHAGAGFNAGLMHPFSGIDHLLAMFAVGFYAARAGGRSLWLLPLTFLSFMGVGGWLALRGAPAPLAEQAIAASVLVLGLLLASGRRMPTPSAVALVTLFATFHGYAHGAEMAAGLRPALYGAGFLVATATLLAAGLATGIAFGRAGSRFPRLAGSAMAAAGAVLLCL